MPERGEKLCIVYCVIPAYPWQEQWRLERPLKNGFPLDEEDG